VRVLKNTVLFERVRSHVNYARVRASGGDWAPQLFTAGREEIQMPNSGAPPGAGWLRYVSLGFDHVWHSLDRIAVSVIGDGVFDVARSAPRNTAATNHHLSDGDGGRYRLEGGTPDASLVAALATWCATTERLIVELVGSKVGASWFGSFAPPRSRRSFRVGPGARSLWAARAGRWSAAGDRRVARAA
jgi:hypothetical protein